MQKPRTPPIPNKPSHLKSLGALNLNSSDPNVENRHSAASSGNPFDDMFQSQQNSENNSSNSSSENNNMEENVDEVIPRMQSTPLLLGSAALNSSIATNPFSDPSLEKPNLPTRPLLPPRPSTALSSGSTPSLATDSLGTASIPVVDRQKNDLSNLFKTPPPISRLSTASRKISGSDSSAGSSQSAGLLLKLREDIHIPNSDKSYKSLPIPDHLVTHEILGGKGPVRGFAVSGFFIVTGGHSVRNYYSPSGEIKTTVNLTANDAKVHSLNFVVYPPTEKTDFYDQFAWAGIEKGELVEFDVSTGEVTAKSSTHASTVIHIVRGPKEMLTIDEHGSLRIWLPDSRGKVSLGQQRPQALRIQAKPTCAILANGLLWTSQGKFIEVYCLNENAASILEKRIDSGKGWSISSSISSLSYNHKTLEVFASHESGKISVYSVEDFERRLVVQATSYKITAMLIVADRIWIGLSTGKILVFETLADGWVCVLDFLAYQGSSVAGLCVDDRAVLGGAFNVMVVSISDGGLLKIWDGLLTAYFIDVNIRESVFDYASMSPVKIAVWTYNLDSRKPIDIENDVFDRFVADRPDTDVFVFGFQELVDLENKGMTAKTFLVGSNKAAKALDSTLDERLLLWQDRLQKLFPATYTVVHVSQLVGLFQFIISKNTFAVNNIATSHIKTGMGGLYGNKGAIATRFFIQDSSFCFVNTHLAAHQSHTSERNKDIAQILKDGSFPKLDLEHHFEGGGDGTMILDHEYVFWSGDLNYRIDDNRQAVMNAIEKCDWSSLWLNDQLLKQMSENRSFGLRSFKELPLSFPPTFKYNRGTNQYDTSEKMRIPAYCDRILFRGNRIIQHSYTRLEIKMSDHKPVVADFTAQAMYMDVSRLEKSFASQTKLAKIRVEANVLDAQQHFLSQYFHIPHPQAVELLLSRPLWSFFSI